MNHLDDPTSYLGDIHYHTCYSDGQRPPEDSIIQALKKGLTIFTPTDHDTLEGSRVANNCIRIINDHPNETIYLDNRQIHCPSQPLLKLLASETTCLFKTTTNRFAEMIHLGIYLDPDNPSPQQTRLVERIDNSQRDLLALDLIKNVIDCGGFVCTMHVGAPPWAMSATLSLNGLDYLSDELSDHCRQFTLVEAYNYSCSLIPFDRLRCRLVTHQANELNLKVIANSDAHRAKSVGKYATNFTLAESPLSWDSLMECLENGHLEVASREHLTPISYLSEGLTLAMARFAPYFQKNKIATPLYTSLGWSPRT